MIHHLPNTFRRNYIGSDQNMCQWIINHIINLLFIIAYYDGSAFAAADAADKYCLAILNGPFAGVVPVSLE